MPRGSIDLQKDGARTKMQGFGICTTMNYMM